MGSEMATDNDKTGSTRILIVVTQKTQMMAWMRKEKIRTTTEEKGEGNGSRPGVGETR